MIERNGMEWNGVHSTDKRKRGKKESASFFLSSPFAAAQVDAE